MILSTFYFTKNKDDRRAERPAATLSPFNSIQKMPQNLKMWFGSKSQSSPDKDGSVGKSSVGKKWPWVQSLPRTANWTSQLNTDQVCLWVANWPMIIWKTQILRCVSLVLKQRLSMSVVYTGLYQETSYWIWQIWQCSWGFGKICR